MIAIGEKFQITGKELKSLLASTKVSYNSAKGLDQDTLHGILNEGSQTDDEKVLARARMVSSDVAVTHTASGDPIERNTTTPLATCRIYTTNAPNLNYDPLSNDIGKLINSS